MRPRNAHHWATRWGPRSSAALLSGSLSARQGESGKQVGDAVDDHAIDDRRARRDADERKACQAPFADFVGDADDLIVAHADRLGELAENVAWRRPGTAQNIHVEMDVDCLRAAIGILEGAAEAIDAE